MAKPTPRQIEFLEDLGITPPKTKTSCHRMINYIIHGNSAQRTTEQERIDILRSAQERWCGKDVQSSDGRIGTVENLCFRSKKEVSEAKAFYKSEVVPFRLIIRYPEQGRRGVAIISTSFVQRLA